MALVQISVKDRGKPVTLQVGDELVLKLPENPTTGYRWQVDSSGSTLFSILRDDFEPPPTISPGGGGTRVFRLRAIAPGDATISLGLCREWETNKAVDQFSVPAIVHP